jgi:hypothetical protein
MIRGPLFAEPRGRGWYIADAEMREVSCALYISKRAAVAAIRAMAAPAEVGHPLFYTVKKFGRRPIVARAQNPQLAALIAIAPGQSRVTA